MISNISVSNDNFNSKKHSIRRGLVTGAVIVGLTFLPGCSYNAAEIVNPNSAVEAVSDNTCFDEVLEDNLGTKINVDILERYLAASERLHGLNLSKLISNLPESDVRLKYSHISDGTYYNSLGEEVSRDDFVSEITDFLDTYGISSSEIDDYSNIINNYCYINAVNSLLDEISLLEEYKKVIGPEQDRYYYACLVLNNEETKVNTWVRDLGYEITADYGLLLVKSKCCDACNYDETHYSEFVLSPYDKDDGAYVKHIGASGNTTTVKLGSFFGDNDLGMASLDVTNSQVNDKRASSEEEDATYSSERNAFLKDALRDYYNVVNQQYKQKGSYIKKINN